MESYLNNGLRQMRSQAPAQTVPGYPGIVWLDLTEDCNMHCVMCRDKPGPCGRVMPLELFQRIVDETCHAATCYSLFNYGEPLMLPNLPDYVAYVSQKKCQEARLELATNGMLLSRKMSEFLVAHGVETCVSFDGATAETFESIRRGRDFGRICENLESLATLTADWPATRSAGVYISILNQNVTELGGIVTLVHSLGVRRLGMGPIVHPCEFRLRATDSALAAITEAINLASDLGMFIEIAPTRLGEYVWVEDHFAPAESYVVDTDCGAGKMCVSIGFNGNVYPCCNAPTVIGNVSDAPFQEIWMGTRYEKFRKSVNNREDMSEKCRACAWVNRLV